MGEKWPIQFSLTNATIYLYPSALHVSGCLIAHLQRQVYNLGSGSSLLGMVTPPGRQPHTQETSTAIVVHLPLKMG
jgi:hypothetical protein